MLFAPLQNKDTLGKILLAPRQNGHKALPGTHRQMGPCSPSGHQRPSASCRTSAPASPPYMPWSQGGEACSGPGTAGCWAASGTSPGAVSAAFCPATCRGENRGYVRCSRWKTRTFKPGPSLQDTSVTRGTAAGLTARGSSQCAKPLLFQQSLPQWEFLPQIPSPVHSK